MRQKTAEIISKEICTGCKVCGDLCPTGAITFTVDEEGFWFPVIDSEKCISCGKCFHCCPVNQEKSKNINIEINQGNAPLQTYAAWNRDDGVRRESTSGGLFSVFAAYVLSQGGYLAGSAYTDDFKAACHITAKDKTEAKKLMGSKYFQSDTAGIYKETKELLESGKTVLFVGTPCQVAALYSYLKKRPENLITVDFICRGVSSPMMQRKKIEYYERKGNSGVILYRDKYKKYAWIDFGARVCYANGKEKFVSRWRDEFLHLFILKNLNIRRACYNCRFKLGHMQSDITIGDFWRIEGVTEKDLRDGVSALMINTVRGINVLEKCRGQLYLMKKPLEKVTAGNPAYVSPPERPQEREEFFRMVTEKGLDAALKKYRYFCAETEKQKKKHERRMRQRPYRFLWDKRSEIDWKNFIYYNFFCKRVIREKYAFLVPYKGAVVALAPDSELYLKGNVHINHYPAYKRGGQTALLQLRDHAKAYIGNTVELAYGCTLSVASGAEFHSGYMTAMINTQIICNHRIEFGNNIMLGRDICIFDSDYHPIFNKRFERINRDGATVLGDNVWVGTKSMILKNSQIGHDVVIGADTLVSGEVGDNLIYTNKREEHISSSEYEAWSR